MMGALKWILGLGLVATIGVGAGVYFAFFGAGPTVSYVTPDLVPLGLTSATPSDQPPVNLPTAVLLPAPFTSQAPLNNCAQRPHTCEVASLSIGDAYRNGDHSVPWRD